MARRKLSLEDIAKLDACIQMRPGGPIPLGWPHYRVLIEIEDDAERSWYEFKAAHEDLSVRQLELAIRGDVFGKILIRGATHTRAKRNGLAARTDQNNRRVRPVRAVTGDRASPVPCCDGEHGGRWRPVRSKANRVKFSPAEEAGYQKLLQDVKRIFDQAEANGVDIRQSTRRTRPDGPAEALWRVRHARDDLLLCRQCGTYEDVLCGEEKRRTFRKSGQEITQTFLVVHHTSQTHQNRKWDRFTERYKAICGACGTYQSSRFVSYFKRR